MPRHYPFVLLLTVLVLVSSSRGEAEAEAAAKAKPEAEPVRVIPVAYRKAPLPGSLATEATVQKKKKDQRPPLTSRDLSLVFEIEEDGGGGPSSSSREWPQYSREITREDREGRSGSDNERRQNDKFLKNVPKEYRHLHEERSKQGRDAFTVSQNEAFDELLEGGFGMLDDKGQLHVAQYDSLKDRRRNLLDRRNPKKFTSSLHRPNQAKAKQGKSLFDELPPLSTFPRHSASLFTPVPFNEQSVSESETVFDYEEVSWTPVPAQNSNSNNEFFVTTSIPFFDQPPPLKEEEKARPSRQTNLPPPSLGSLPQQSSDQHDLPAFGPPYHDDTVIAQEVNRRQPASGPPILQGQFPQQQQHRQDNQEQQPQALPFTHGQQQGSFVSLDEPVSLVLKHDGVFPQKPFISQQTPHFTPSQPEIAPEKDGQSLPPVFSPTDSGLDSTQVIFNPQSFQAKSDNDYNKHEQPEARRTTPEPRAQPFFGTKTFVVEPQQPQDHQAQNPPPPPQDPRSANHNQQDSQYLPKEHRTANHDTQQQLPQTQAQLTNHQVFDEIYKSQRQDNGGGNFDESVGFHKFSMNGIDVEFDIMGKDAQESPKVNVKKNKQRGRGRRKKIGKRVRINKKKRRQNIKKPEEDPNIAEDQGKEKKRPERDHGHVPPHLFHTTPAPQFEHFPYQPHGPVKHSPPTYGPEPRPPGHPTKSPPSPFTFPPHDEPNLLHPIHVNIHIDPSKQHHPPPLEHQEILLHQPGPPHGTIKGPPYPVTVSPDHAVFVPNPHEPHHPPPPPHHPPLHHPSPLHDPTPLPHHPTPPPPHHSTPPPLVHHLPPAPHPHTTPSPHIIHHSEPPIHPFLIEGHSTTPSPLEISSLPPAIFHNNDARENILAITKAPTRHYSQTTNHPEEVSTLPPLPASYGGKYKAPVQHHRAPPIHLPKPPLHHPKGPLHHPKGPLHHPKGPIHHPKGPLHHPKGPLHHPKPHLPHPEPHHPTKGPLNHFIASTTLPPRQYVHDVTPAPFLDEHVSQISKPQDFEIPKILDTYEIADHIHKDGNHLVPPKHKVVVEDTFHDFEASPRPNFIPPHKDEEPDYGRPTPTPIPGQPQQYLTQEDLRNKFESSKNVYGVRALPVKNKYIHHLYHKPGRHHHGPTTPKPVYHPDPKAKIYKPKPAKTYFDPHPTSPFPQDDYVPDHHHHPYGPTPKPRSLARKPFIHSLPPPPPPPPSPVPLHTATVVPLPHVYGRGNGGGGGVVDLAQVESENEESAPLRQATVRRNPVKRVVLPTLLRSGNLFEGEEGSEIKPTITPFVKIDEVREDEIDLPPVQAFTSREALETAQSQEVFFAPERPSSQEVFFSPEVPRPSSQEVFFAPEAPREENNSGFDPQQSLGGPEIDDGLLVNTNRRSSLFSENARLDKSGPFMPVIRRPRKTVGVTVKKIVQKS